MPSRQQRFEGPDLETLLDRVRAELGDGARIVAANRVRKGGVGGFFSRESYEVIVDVVEVPAPAPIEPLIVDLREPTGRSLEETVDVVTAAASSVLELAEAVNGTERARQTRRGRKGAKADSAKAAADSRNVEGEPIVDLTAAASMPAMADVDTPVSTETERFVQILDRIARDVDARRDDIEAIAEPVVEHPMPEIDRSLAMPVIERSTPTVERTEDQRVTHARAENARRAARAARPMANEIALDEIAIEREAVGVFTPTATPFLPPRVRRSRDVEVIERPENLLARMGVPPRFIPRGVSGAQLRGALIEALAQLPVAEPLPDANGVVVAVVGVGAQPVMLARSLATEQGLDPDNLVLATARELGEGIPSWLQITDAATAEERRRSWRRRDHPTLVAVSVPAVTAGADWAREMLDHLEPTQTWGIVNAAWKAEDAQAWADRLGGFDVLALEHLADTVSPAAPLQLDIPVARLDGMIASPLRWAEILTERLVGR